MIEICISKKVFFFDVGNMIAYRRTEAGRTPPSASYINEFCPSVNIFEHLNSFRAVLEQF